jgi:Fe2+ or Zn2+ uptake regulation protein
MVASSRKPACPDPSVTHLREALEKAGLRFTRQRAAVYQFLHATHAHPTAEDVFAGVRPVIDNISLATVYKALDALVESGLVTRIPYREGPCRYECRQEPHYHFHCLDTHRIYDLPTRYDPDLISKLDPHLIETLRRQGFRVTGYHLELHGYMERAVFKNNS